MGVPQFLFMAAGTVIQYLLSGPFWAASFIALFAAFMSVGFFGFGKGRSNYATIYVEDMRTWKQIFIMFVFYSALINFVFLMVL